MRVSMQKPGLNMCGGYVRELLYEKADLVLVFRFWGILATSAMRAATLIVAGLYLENAVDAPVDNIPSAIADR